MYVHTTAGRIVKAVGYKQLKRLTDKALRRTNTRYLARRTADEPHMTKTQAGY